MKMVANDDFPRNNLVNHVNKCREKIELCLVMVGLHKRESLFKLLPFSYNNVPIVFIISITSALSPNLASIWPCLLMTTVVGKLVAW